VWREGPTARTGSTTKTARQRLQLHDISETIRDHMSAELVDNLALARVVGRMFDHRRAHIDVAGWMLDERGSASSGCATPATGSGRRRVREKWTRSPREWDEYFERAHQSGSDTGNDEEENYVEDHCQVRGKDMVLVLSNHQGQWLIGETPIKKNLTELCPNGGTLEVVVQGPNLEFYDGRHSRYSKRHLARDLAAGQRLVA
jgi:hypothetical protein